MTRITILAITLTGCVSLKAPRRTYISHPHTEAERTRLAEGHPDTRREREELARRTR